MNHRSSGLMLSDAVEGFIQFKMAEGRSPRTIVGYRHDLREWLAYAGDKKVEKFDAEELRAFLNYLRTDYNPAPPVEDQQPGGGRIPLFLQEAQLGFARDKRNGRHRWTPSA